MATLDDRILNLLGQGVGLDDDEIAARLGVVRQHVNQTCRRLNAQGLVRREVGPRGKIVNRRTDAPAPEPRPPRSTAVEDFITEDEVKAAVKAHLEAQGYQVEVVWGKGRGIDVEASRAGSRLVVEAKGEVASQPQKTNYFLHALGELVQRMSNQEADYGLALPDNGTFRGLVDRLPRLAKDRLRLRVYFVSRSGDGLSVREED